MVTGDTEDGEGALPKRIRTIAPDLPIALSLDLHATIGDGVADNRTALAGHMTCPHVDMYETGEHVGRIAAPAEVLRQGPEDVATFAVCDPASVRAMIEAGVGVTSSDNSLFSFRNVRRPIFPLDPDTPERPNHRPPAV